MWSAVCREKGRWITCTGYLGATCIFVNKFWYLKRARRCREHSTRSSQDSECLSTLLPERCWFWRRACGASSPRALVCLRAAVDFILQRSREETRGDEGGIKSGTFFLLAYPKTAFVSVTMVWGLLMQTGLVRLSPGPRGPARSGGHRKPTNPLPPHSAREYKRLLISWLWGANSRVGLGKCVCVYLCVSVLQSLKATQTFFE